MNSTSARLRFLIFKCDRDLLLKRLQLHLLGIRDRHPRLLLPRQRLELLLEIRHHPIRFSIIGDRFLRILVTRHRRVLRNKIAQLLGFIHQLLSFHGHRSLLVRPATILSKVRILQHSNGPLSPPDSSSPDRRTRPRRSDKVDRTRHWCRRCHRSLLETGHYTLKDRILNTPMDRYHRQTRLLPPDRLHFRAVAAHRLQNRPRSSSVSAPSAPSSPNNSPAPASGNSSSPTAILSNSPTSSARSFTAKPTSVTRCRRPSPPPIACARSIQKSRSNRSSSTFTPATSSNSSKASARASSSTAPTTSRRAISSTTSP